jgi:hypothetical protein
MHGYSSWSFSAPPRLCARRSLGTVLVAASPPAASLPRPDSRQGLFGFAGGRLYYWWK